MLLSGKLVASAKKAELKERIAGLGFAPNLAIITNEDFSAQSYTNRLIKLCAEMGVGVECVNGQNFTAKQYNTLLVNFCSEERFHGVMMMQPFPKDVMLGLLVPYKDVDGISYLSLGKLMQGDITCAPCTPKAVMAMLDYYNIPIAGKNVAVVGRSNTVGNPLAQLLMRRDATVTLMHSKSDLCQLVDFDIVVSAIGKPHFFNNHRKFDRNAIIIDVGINQLEGVMVGDCHTEKIEPYVKGISPVPGGVGAVTNLMLIESLLDKIATR